MTLQVVLGADHGGFAFKAELLPWLRDHGYQVVDVGAHSLDPVDDYPDFAKEVAWVVSSGQADRGLLVCGSGIGACIVANKVPGVRAGVCHDTYSAHQGVEHDDMNVLCLGARIIGMELARELVLVFLKASFTAEKRHRRRLEKLLALERSALQEGKAPRRGRRCENL